MIAILAEDDSDADALSHLVKRHFDDTRLTVKKKGYDGGSGLCRKGARDIKTWLRQGVKRFVVCHDSDSHPPYQVREKIMNAVVKPSGAESHCCIVVPVQEIEAWLIADELAINDVIPTFQFEGHATPEHIGSPKEWLVGQSKAKNGKPLYSPKTFNAAVAKRLRLDVVSKKCPSFAAFLDCLSKP